MKTFIFSLLVVLSLAAVASSEPFDVLDCGKGHNMMAFHHTQFPSRFIMVDDNGEFTVEANSRNEVRVYTSMGKFVNCILQDKGRYYQAGFSGEDRKEIAQNSCGAEIHRIIMKEYRGN